MKHSRKTNKKAEKGKTGLMKAGELARRTGVQRGTIQYYIKEGLLPRPRKSSRNMAYYDESYVERIRLIKELQEKRFLPLSVIRRILKEDDQLSLSELRSVMELDGKVFKGVNYKPTLRPLPAEDVLKRWKVSKSDVAKLERLGIVDSFKRGRKKYYSGLDVAIIECWVRMREAGFDKKLGFSAEHILPHKELITMMVEEEARTFLNHVVGKVSTEKMVQMVDDGLVILNEYIALTRRKLLEKFVREYAKGRSKE